MPSRRKILALLTLLALNSVASKTQAQVPQIKVDLSRTIKNELSQGPAGANLCWLLDSDKKRSPSESMLKAIDEMGCGSLRFPYGALADNYLWHTPPYDNTHNGLRPRVAALRWAPGKWKWAVDAKGHFKNAMDFDEYMHMCQKLDIKPLVVLNALAYKIPGGPSYEELKTNAIEWVKYAKKMNYEVAYWQIGNEVDHHKKRITRDEYLALYFDFAAGIKAVDPDATIGPGILSDTNYFKRIITEHPELIDFVSVHQYCWPYLFKDLDSYEGWKEYTGGMGRNVGRMQRKVNASSKPDLPILVTETSTHTVGNKNVAYVAFWWFELVMAQISTEDVVYSYFWGTHTPWNGPKDEEINDGSVLLRLDDNSRKPTGEVSRFVNTYLLEKLVSSTKANGYVRSYASTNHARDKLNLLLLNKNDTEETTKIDIKGIPEGSRFKVTSLLAEQADSRELRYHKFPDVTLLRENVKVELPPLSLTVLEYSE